MTVRLFLAGEKIGPQLKRVGVKNRQKILHAERGAAQKARDVVLSKGRKDIASAGKFGSRWIDGFQGKITEGGGFIRVAFTQKVPYWRVFQFGAIIRGKPLLFIPFSFAKDAQGVRARDYPGRLFRVTRRRDGLIMLFTANPGAEATPKYFGKESVRIPKKFHLVEIIRDTARHMKDYYKESFKNGK